MDPSWYFDTGAIGHVTPDLHKLNIIDDYTGDDKLQVGNGNNLSISHVGSSSFSDLTLPNVFLVPELTKSLLSVSKLTRDNNVFMEFWPSHCFVKDFQGQKTDIQLFIFIWLLKRKKKSQTFLCLSNICFYLTETQVLIDLQNTNQSSIGSLLVVVSRLIMN